MTYSYKHLCSLLVCLMLTCSTFGGTIFVRTNAIGENDGESWEDAYTSLADALAAAEEGDQIWVAAGSYYPTTSNNRSISFVLPKGVRILGGFPNSGTPTLANRNVATNLTILSGDINQSGDLTGNSYNVIYTKNVNSSTILDGFTITGGNADELVVANFPVLRENGGAAWYNESSNNSSSNPSIKNCIFSNNNASNRGGALYHRAGLAAMTNYTLENCIFQNNTAGRNGGAIYNAQAGTDSECSPIVLNTNFISNTAGQSGGAIYNDGAYFGVVSGSYTNCDFNGNIAINNEGGAIYNNAAFQGITNPIFNNCNFTSNMAVPGSGGAIYTDASGQGIANFRVTNCVFDQNVSSVYGGAICNIISNQGEIKPIYTNCIFKENSSTNGGATYSRGVFGSNLDVIITNCVFYKNQGNIGGAIYQNETGSTSLVTTKVSNSIFEENIAGFSSIFHLTGPSSIGVNHSIFDTNNCFDLVQGEGTSEADCNGNNIFNQDPLFVDADNGNFNLAITSAAINAGNNGDIPSFVTEDFLGNPRIAGGAVDIGIYEQVNTNSDNDDDGILDINDNCPLVANAGQEDIDGDGTGTVCDCDDSIATGTGCNTGCSTFYLDNDNDGFGNPLSSITTCVAPSGYISNNQDFNDNDNTLYPNAPELCDGKDNNNNGQIDEGTDDDNDGVCNEDDQCEGGDDNKDDNGNGIPDDCESQLTIACPADITISTAAGQSTAIVTWTMPTASTNCNEGGTSEGDCVVEPIDGFTYKGNFNGSDYYLSDSGAFWTTAQAIAAANGANLVVINNQEENDFVKSIIGSSIIHIGITDQVTEGTFGWADGDENNTFTNFEGTPGEADYGIMYFWNGKWAVDGDYTKQYVIEKTCEEGNDGGLMVQQTLGLTSGDSFPIGTTPITYTASDNCGDEKTCTFNVIVEATASNIVLNCPADVTINAPLGATEAIVTWDEPMPTSDCTGTVTITASQNSGTDFPVGTTTVTYTATDNCGSTITCEFDVTVIGTNSTIVLECPSDVTVNAIPNATEAIVTWDEPMPTSNCAGIITTTASQNSGTDFPVGTTTITYTATDNCGSTITCEFDVTVIGTNSTILLECPSDVTVNAIPNATEAIVTWDEPMPTSDCAGIITTTASQNSGTDFPVGTTTITYRAAESCGGTMSC
ncbi:MAG: HYR domain-containing protein [Saprospiraceae bacterium]